MPIFLRPRLVYISYYPILVRHCSECFRYGTMRRKICWRHVANEVYRTAGNFWNRSRNRIFFKKKFHLNPIFASGISKFSARTYSAHCQNDYWNQFFIFITDLYMKLTWAILSLKTTVLQVVSIYFNHWVLPYGIPAFLLMERSTNIVKMRSWRRYV